MSAPETIPGDTLWTTTRSCNNGDIALSSSYNMGYSVQQIPVAGYLDPPVRNERTGTSTWTFAAVNFVTDPLTVFSLAIVCAHPN